MKNYAEDLLAHPLPQLGHVLEPELLMRWIISRDAQFSRPIANLLPL